MTIRTRLAIWNSVVIAVSTTLLGVAVYAVASWSLSSSIDTELRRRLSLSREYPPGPPPGARDDQRPAPPPDQQSDSSRRRRLEIERELLFPRMIRRNGTNPDFMAGEPWDPSVVPEVWASGRTVLTTVFTSAAGQSRVPVRVVSGIIKARDGEEAIVQHAASLTFLQDQQRLLGGVLVVLVPLSWILSALAGSWLTRMSLAPVRRIIAAAEGIGPGDWTTRLPQDGGDEMAQLAATVNHSLDRNADSYRRLEAFVADASHELKSPLTAVLLRASTSSDDPETMRASLSEIHGSALAMRRMVDDLLLMARIGAGTDDLSERVDLGALVCEVADEHIDTFGERLEVDAAPKVVVIGDSGLLKRLLDNLLRNAAVHAGMHAEVRVAVEARGPLACLTVTDDGPGVPKEHIERVFDRFYRVDQVRTHGEGWVGQGSGLGLALVTAITQIHGGKVILTSEPGQGAQFTVLIPLAPPAF